MKKILNCPIYASLDPSRDRKGAFAAGRSRSIAEMVGRTPWSARDPLVALFANEGSVTQRAGQADWGVGRGPGGPPHHSCVFPTEALCPL